MFGMKLDWNVIQENVPKLKKKFQRTQWVIFPALIAANPNPNNAKNNTQYTKTTETNNIYTQFSN